MIFSEICRLSAPKSHCRIAALSWSQKFDWIAVSGSDGALQILKLQWIAGKNESKLLSAGMGVIYRQQCKGHHGLVKLSQWNDVYEKIASFDSQGTIIIWQFTGDTFIPLEANHRQSGSVATDFVWSPNGKLACIAYRDGIVAVSGTTGQLWQIELSNVCVTWTPDSSGVAVAPRQSGCVYVLRASDGERQGAVPVVSREDGHEIVAAAWYAGVDGVPSDAPCLAVCFDNGLVQVFEHANDEVPVLVETMLRISSAAWSPDGRLLAIAGATEPAAHSPFQNEYTTAVACVVYFYTADGKLVAKHAVAGADVTALAWHRSGLRMALALPRAIAMFEVRTGPVQHIANTVPTQLASNPLLHALQHPSHTKHATPATALLPTLPQVGALDTSRWCGGARGRCVALRGSARPSTSAKARLPLPNTERSVDTGDTSHSAPGSMSEAVAMAAAEAREALTPTLNRNSDEYTIVYTPSSAPNRGAAIQLVFWQADAGHVLVRSLPLGDELLAMASHGAHCVVATSRRTKSDAVEYKLSLWNADGVMLREKAIEIEPLQLVLTASLACVASRDVLCLWTWDDSAAPSADNPFASESQYLMVQSVGNPIVSIGASEKLVALCRRNGVLHVFQLPGLRKETKHKLDATAMHIAINCDSTQAAIVDHHGNLKILSLQATLVQTLFLIDSRDVWDVCWSRTNPTQFAVTERVQTHTFAANAHADVIINSAQIVDFSGDDIVAVQLDSVLANAVAPPSAALLRFTATPSLKLTSGGDAWCLDFAFAPTHRDLLRAAATGDRLWFERLRDDSVDADECAWARDADGRTPLHWAAIGAHASIAEVLLAADRGSFQHDSGNSAVTRLSPETTHKHKSNKNVQNNVNKNNQNNNNNNDDDELSSMRRGGLLEARDNDGQTPLHAAALAGRMELIMLLLQRGAACNAADSLGRTPAHLAAGASSLAKGVSQSTTRLHDGSAAVLSDSAACLQYLLAAGAAPSSTDNAGRTPLHYAAYAGHQGAVEVLVKHLAKQPPSKTSSPNKQQQQQNSADKDRALFQSKLDVHDSDGRTPLHWAAAAGHASTCLTLLRSGAQLLSCCDTYGKTPLHYAATVSHDDDSNNNSNNSSITNVGVRRTSSHNEAPLVLRALLSAAAAATDASIPEPCTCPMPHCPSKTPAAEQRAATSSTNDTDARNGERRVLRRLVAARDAVGRTALHDAAGAGRAPAVRALLEAGAPPNARDDALRAPLHYAAQALGGEAAVDALLKAGAVCSPVDASGLTPLLRAALAGRRASVDLLRVADAAERARRDADASRYVPAKKMLERALRELDAFKNDERLAAAAAAATTTNSSANGNHKSTKSTMKNGDLNGSALRTSSGSTTSSSSSSSTSTTTTTTNTDTTAPTKSNGIVNTENNKSRQQSSATHDSSKMLDSSTQTDTPAAPPPLISTSTQTALDDDLLATLPLAVLTAREAEAEAMLARVRAARAARLTQLVDLCVSCNEQRRTALLLPCRHVAHCWTCHQAQLPPRKSSTGDVKAKSPHKRRNKKSRSPRSPRHNADDTTNNVVCVICSKRSNDVIKINK